MDPTIRLSRSDAERSADAEGIERLRAENERLRSYVTTNASCPCCEETEQCLPECTFKDDAPGWGNRSYDDVLQARAALRGEKQR